MTCRELTEFLMAYVEGSLPAEERAIFDRHLSICPPCVTYVASYEATLNLERAAFAGPDEAVGEDVPETLVRAILASRGK